MSPSTVPFEESEQDPTAAAQAETAGAQAPVARRRGRPALMTGAQVVELLREAERTDALFRVHVDRPALYARARRLFGSWAGALRAAGIDYDATVRRARGRSIEGRRLRARG